jgi:hypothetical protein
MPTRPILPVLTAGFAVMLLQGTQPVGAQHRAGALTGQITSEAAGAMQGTEQVVPTAMIRQA